MRIVLDLQGAQSLSSRHRGIGRYTLSLSRSIVSNRGEHEIIVVLNAHFQEALDELYREFSQLMPRENIVVWHSPNPIAHLDPYNSDRRAVAEDIRESLLASLDPDMVLVLSLFEGFEDDSATSISRSFSTPTAVILYDLIPLIHSHIYLENPNLKSWYMGKIESLKSADLLLSISESAKKEAHDYLNIEEDRVVNISTAADAHFYPKSIDDAQELEIRKRYNIYKPFIMYTGGMDHRKNIEGLIRAYALLPQDIRQDYQLAIVCSISRSNRDSLIELALGSGLESGDVILTGFVSDDDLVTLYNLCELFVFPSWHEGFGLPALEAMLCERVVIGSNLSSLPEVIGLEDALFDPKDDLSISSKMLEALRSSEFREKFLLHAKEQTKKFSWDRSAKAAISAIERWVSSDESSKEKDVDVSHKPKLAYLSPLRPLRSGISDYSAELLPALGRYYEIDIITDQSDIGDEFVLESTHIRSVDWFVEHNGIYDRILYHFGNSSFHQHMFDLLDKIPGVVMLHDFFLSGVTAKIAYDEQNPPLWMDTLYRSHGYLALKEHFTTDELNDVILKYPANLPVLQNALGVIVHSQNSIKLRDEWYGSTSQPWATLPLLRVPSPTFDRAKSKSSLGFSPDSILICSFGLISPTKLNHRLIKAFLNSSISSKKNIYLIFVGESSNLEYEQEIRELFADSEAKDRITITGWTELDTFKSYLQAADIGVQLRTDSRGESSASVLDCMNYGVATIVNANGSMADLPKDAVEMLDDEFLDSDLSRLLEELCSSMDRRYELGHRAMEIIRQHHNPDYCAKEYRRYIESYYKTTSDKFVGLMERVAVHTLNWDDSELVKLSRDIARDFPPEPRLKQILVDISILQNSNSSDMIKRRFIEFLKRSINNPPKGYRIEPIYLADSGRYYCYAREFTKSLLDISADILVDEAVDIYREDIFVGSDISTLVSDESRETLRDIYYSGGVISLILYDLDFLNGSDRYSEQLEMISSMDMIFTLNRADRSRVTKALELERLDSSVAFGIEDIDISLRETISILFEYIKRYDIGDKITWRVEGPFDSSYSLAMINRELAMALDDMGHDVILHSTEGHGDFLPRSEFLQQHPQIDRLYQRSISHKQESADISSRNIYPPRVNDMRSPINLLHNYAWEETTFPQEWVANFNTHLQGMVVTSDYVKKIMVDNGVKIPIQVSGNGVDHWERITPDVDYGLDDDHSFRFLHVSSCFPRKGVDILLKSYGEGFTSQDDVVLIIKTFANPHNEIYRWIDEAKSLYRDYPDIIVIEDDLSPSQLKSLYHYSDVLVAPSRAEGFGLPLAEGMLSGLSVIATGWSGQVDFCSKDSAWLIDYEFVPAQSHFELSDSVWAEPSQEHLAKLMREVYELPSEQRAERSARGRELLLDKYRWSSVADRLVKASREFAKRSESSTPKVGWVTTWNSKCGIASYSKHLIGYIPYDISILAPYCDELIDIDGSNVYRCWREERDDFSELMRVVDDLELDTIVLQFNYGFYSFHYLYEFLYKQYERGRKIIIMMHSTTDPTHIEFKDLKIILPLFEYVDRILVHSLSDLNHLKEHGLVDNVTLFPHGIVDWRSTAPRDSSDKFILGSYGFFLPHKGLLELIDSVKIIKDRGVDIYLKMINAKYPQPISQELIDEAYSKIEELGLQSDIELVTEFLSDDDSLSRLSECDLLLFPYQETAESSSASVRYGLSTRVAVAVTPLDIFEDVCQATYRLSGFTPEDMADSIIEIAEGIKNGSQVAQDQKISADKWCESHRYSKIGERLGNMIEAIGTIGIS
jgi:glycosyltransferase involved in cell wall biosynthesis